MRTHKVGTLTLGLMLVLFGVLFLIHLFGGMLSYRLIFSLWPLTLISLGAEVLLSMIPASRTAFQLDGKAVALMVLLMLFTMAMAGLDLGLRWLEPTADFTADFCAKSPLPPSSSFGIIVLQRVA